MLNIPATQTLKDRYLAFLEGNLSQTSPLNDKAFLRVLSAVLALNHTELYKYSTERSEQNLALTATGDDLSVVGEEFGVIRKVAEATVLTITLPAIDGTEIPSTVYFTGDLNGILYFPASSAIANGGFATLSVTAEETGVVGNLNVGNTLTISRAVAGAESVATVTVIENLGAEQEDIEVYRQRVLFAERVQTGGSNASDYKIWAEGVAGVRRAFVYSGKPFDDPEISYPGDRTVYIEATTDIDPDGIAPQALLDEVRVALNVDPLTGLSRPALGLVDATLYVESIVRNPIYIEVRNLTVLSTLESQAKEDIETALTQYLFALQPFVVGIDLLSSKNNVITEVSISDVVQDVLNKYGASAGEVVFGLSLGASQQQKTLLDNEVVKLGGITYVS